MPREQIRSEKTKLKLLQSKILLKTGTLDDSQSLLFSKEWTDTFLTLHHSRIIFENNIELQVNDSLLIISRSPSFFELVFAAMLEENSSLFIVRFDSLRSFIDTTAAILLSKRPSWIMSPICQMCSSTFSFFTRVHHCRNCGRTICSICSKFSNLEILGYVQEQRICMQCISKVEESVHFICSFRKKEMNSSVMDNLYDLPYNQSVLAASLKA